MVVEQPGLHYDPVVPLKDRGHLSVCSELVESDSSYLFFGHHCSPPPPREVPLDRVSVR